MKINLDAAKSRDDIIAASNALSDLNLFYSIIALCENGLLRAPSQGAALRIIKIVKAEVGKRFKDYDRASANIIRRFTR